MRVRHWVLLGASALFVSGIVASGCGGDSANPPATTDAGQDVSLQDTAPPPDTSVQDNAIADTNTCVIDADITKVNPPDAALEGGTSVGQCLGCVKTACGTQLNDCNADCPCNTLVWGVFQCLEQKGLNPTCFAGLTGANDTAEQNFAACAVAACRPDCLGGGGDGGKDGANDADDGG
jgi:hypothetical protein